MHEAYIQLIKSAGYRVFIRPSRGPITYCFYTDGKHIGYAQWETFRQHVSSVHKPCRECGTGFQIADKINPETLRKALLCVAPYWHYGDFKYVVKYHDWDAYHNASKWNSELVEV